MSGNLKILTDDRFDSEVINSQIPVLVDFSAEWCAPCKMLAPVIHELADEYVGRVMVGKVDIDQNRNKASEYGIQGVPTVIIFKNGQPVKKFVGLVTKDRITAALDEVL